VTEWSRRDYLVAAAAIGLPAAARQRAQRGSARLAARPASPRDPVGPGFRRLGLAGERDGIWLVPRSYRSGQPAPLLVALHGAGSRAEQPVELLRADAETYGIIMLGIDARDYTWDAIRGSWGGDVRFIDRALREVFDRVAVDPARVAIGGFSDGASYALGLGLGNGDLFASILAFSPGFIPASDSPPAGRPRVFVSHGRRDDVLPIDTTSRRIVPALERAGYRVTYREFDAGHTVPRDTARAALSWLAGTEG
jgi:predicted esterase